MISEASPDLMFGIPPAWPVLSARNFIILGLPALQSRKGRLRLGIQRVYRGTRYLFALCPMTVEGTELLYDVWMLLGA